MFNVIYLQHDEMSGAEDSYRRLLDLIAIFAELLDSWRAGGLLTWELDPIDWAKRP